MGEIDEKIEADGKRGLCEGLARVVSAVMHPFMVPIYVILVLLYGGTIHGFMSANVKLFIVLVVVANTVVLPFGFVRLTNVMEYLKAMPEQSKRMMTIVVCASLYATCVFVFSDILTAFFVRRIFIAAIGCAMMSLAITYFWNISTHMVAVGWGFSMLLLVSMSGMGELLLPIAMFVLLGGAVASARLYLGQNTPMQVVVGLFGGILMGIILMVR